MTHALSSSVRLDQNAEQEAGPIVGNAEERAGRAHAQNSKKRSRRLSVRVLVIGSSIFMKTSEEISKQLLARAVKISTIAFCSLGDLCYSRFVVVVEKEMSRLCSALLLVNEYCSSCLPCFPAENT